MQKMGHETTAENADKIYGSLVVYVLLEQNVLYYDSPYTLPGIKCGGGGTWIEREENTSRSWYFGLRSQVLRKRLK